VSDADDAGLLRQLRDAEATLGERPTARVRRAVLRAAAQAVGPGLNAPPRAAPTRPGRSLWPRNWGWSIPVAASVLVGAIAVGVVSEVQRSAAPTSATAVASAAPAEKKTPAPEAIASPRREAGAMAPAPGFAAKRDAGTASPAAKSVAPLAARRAVPVLPGANREPSEAYAAPAQRTRTQAQDALVELDTRPGPAAPTDAQVQAPAPTGAKLPMQPQTPQRWVERIVALRRAGQQDEADRELALLRKRFPQFVVPAEALRPER